jgi:hypothetical protein
MQRKGGNGEAAAGSRDVGLTRPVPASGGVGAAPRQEYPATVSATTTALVRLLPDHEHDGDRVGEALTAGDVTLIYWPGLDELC